MLSVLMFICIDEFVLQYLADERSQPAVFEAHYWFR